LLPNNPLSGSPAQTSIPQAYIQLDDQRNTSKHSSNSIKITNKPSPEQPNETMHYIHHTNTSTHTTLKTDYFNINPTCSLRLSVAVCLVDGGVRVVPAGAALWQQGEESTETEDIGEYGGER
jgi:hypothetical protein